MRQQFVRHRADRKNIRPGIDVVAPDLFRRHVVQRPQDRARDRDLEAISLAMPKSRILTVPSGPT
jgi:hypothetical protein